MATIRIPRTPTFRHHKPSNQGFVEIDGKRHYLGRYDLQSTKQAYHAFISEWMANGHRLPVAPEEITLLELADQYLEHCEVYYRDASGNPSSTQIENVATIKKVLALYAEIPAASFGPNALRAVRQHWIDDNLSITTINSRVGMIRRMFKWAVSYEMIPVETYQALATLPGLRKGRGVGKDPVEREPVPMADIDATLEHLTKPLQAIVRLQLCTGARPSEILNLKRGDLDCSGETWSAVIREHKTNYKGKKRSLFFGPRAQAVLRPFLLRNDDDYLFSPREAEKERHVRDRTGKGRRANQKPNRNKSGRTVGDHYEAHAYNRAITRACTKADVERWCPYRLRHTAATIMEATADLETASAILGHSGLNITQVYVHRDNKTAAAWAATHG